MRKLFSLVNRVNAHPAAHHAHHVAYCLYYGFAVLEDRGAKLVIVSTLFVFCVLSSLKGKGAE